MGLVLGLGRVGVLQAAHLRFARAALLEHPRPRAFPHARAHLGDLARVSAAHAARLLPLSPLVRVGVRVRDRLG